MSAWDLVTEGGQENIAEKNSYILPKNRTRTLTHMKKSHKLWKAIKLVRETRIFCL